MYGFKYYKNNSEKPSVEVSFNQKFCDDRVFFENEDIIVIIDGIVINKLDLLSASKLDSWKSYITEEFGNDKYFFKQLRGSYSGLIYDKSTDVTIVFSDQLGSKFVYYSKIGNSFYAFSNVSELYERLYSEGKRISLNEVGVRMVVEHGGTFAGYTICNEVRRIQPGCFIEINKENIVTEHQYYLLNNTPDNSKTEDEWIEIIDKLYRRAIQLQYNKDLEYDYKHLANLSGGIDCRMTNFVSHQMGYLHQLNVTFSQTGFSDETTAKQIAHDLCNEWLFKSLDNGLWLYDVDECVRQKGGNRLYYAIAHNRSLFKYVNENTYGVIHSGTQGEIFKGETDVDYDTIIKNICFEPSIKYSNQELQTIYYRYLGCVEINENFSPLLELDFLEAILKIPIELRRNGYIYKKWIIKKYPEADKYVWSTTGARLSCKFNPKIRICGHEAYLRQIPDMIRQKIKGNGPFAMNPIPQYISQNKDLRKYLLSYYSYLNKIENNSIKEYLDKQSKSGLSLIKTVTILSAIKIFNFK